MTGKYRRSKQREVILRLLQSTESHPTASWIYDKLKSEFPHLSLGTVYRNLNILSEQGLIKKIDCGSTFDRFEANNHPHYHFICEQCNSVFDLKTPIMNNLEDQLSGLHNFTIHSHMIEFFGVCEACKKQ
ncbi:MAG: transcriptional repressor [Spirochaetales bacterium]|nr:transcriptional repressor [Spirochaetales bacterium]